MYVLPLFYRTFYINTKINGVDFQESLLKSRKNIWNKQVKNYELKIVEQGNESETIKGDEISLNIKANAEIKSALKETNYHFSGQVLFFQKCYSNYNRSSV